MEKVGEFDVESGALVVTDPCYDLGTWCAGKITGVLNGRWHASIDHLPDDPYYTSSIHIVHESHSHDVGSLEFTLSPFEVGVDSGQAGFFDESIYPPGVRPNDSYWNGDEFYDECCYATCDSANGFGVIRGKGVVTRSGFGDGGYSCYVARDPGGHVVAAKIVFISDDEEDE